MEKFSVESSRIERPAQSPAWFDLLTLNHGLQFTNRPEVARGQFQIIVNCYQ